MQHIILVIFLAILSVSLISCSNNNNPNNDSTSLSGVSGLESRLVAANCNAVGPSSALEFSNPFSNAISINNMIDAKNIKTQPNRWIAVSRGGGVYWFDSTWNASETPRLLFSINVDQEGEGGLLGVALHPNFSNNGYVYFYYTIDGSPLISVLARRTLTNLESDISWDNNSHQELLRLNQPASNHNGGSLHFGPIDGYLYLALGDGGPASEQPLDPQTWLGSMLRLDVDNPSNGNNYGIPADNPFAQGQAAFGNGAPEVWAWGFRNPYRWSIDSLTGDVWVADVGQSSREEVNFVQAGGNYGWPCREGDIDGPRANDSFCTSQDPNDFIAPAVAPTRGDGWIAIIGGFVYRGGSLPELNGAFIYGDFILSQFWAIKHNGNASFQNQQLDITNSPFRSYVQSSDGEVYGLGDEFSLIQERNTTGGPAATLSQTGCVDINTPTQPAAGLMPYDMVEGFWSDGATKDRYVSIPDNTEVIVESDGDLTFPIGSVFLKNFFLNDVLIESRLLMHYAQGLWSGYSYRWRSDGSDADLITESTTVEIQGQDWTFLNSGQCLACHTEAAGRALGPELPQLASEQTYPSTGITANQLVTWEHVGLFNRRLSNSEKTTALTPSRNNIAGDTEAKARSYLHSNCSQCHRAAGPANTAFDFNRQLSFSEMNICNTDPIRGDLGIANAKILSPGSTALSLIIQRMNVLDNNRMPPIASHVIDSEGVSVLSDWINSLNGCN